MAIFYALCAGIITTAVVIVAMNLVATLKQVRATAKAIEYLAINANDRIEATRGFFDTINNVSNSIRSGWIKAAQFGISLISNYRNWKDRERA